MHLSSASHLILLSSLLLLLSAVTSGETEVKPEVRSIKSPVCCKALITNQPLVKMRNCYILPATEKCLKSVVFTDTISQLYCIDPEAPWLGRRMKRLERNGVKCVDYTTV